MSLKIEHAPVSFLQTAPRRSRSAAIWIGVVALLGLYASVVFSVAARKGLSFDEGEEMAVGYNQWQRHDFRMEGANGDFIKRWATIPLLISRPKLPSTDQWYWRQGGAYELGYAFCFNEGNDVGALLRQTRTMSIVLGLGVGLTVFFISRALFGDRGGLISLGLFAVSPHMLAFGAVVSTEMSICLFLLGATWCAWRLLHRVTLGRLMASLAFAALAALAKPTALTLLPIVIVMIVVKLWAPRPLAWDIGSPTTITSRGRQIVIFSALLIAHAAAGWTAIWADYEFRYTASPWPNDPTITIARIPHPDPVSPVVGKFMAWSRRAHFLPEGFLEGADRLLQHNDNRITFLDGQWKIGGWAHFFPRALWLKSSPAFLLLVLIALAWWWHVRRIRLKAPPAFGDSAPVPSMYEATPLIALICAVLGAAVAQNLNIGHRHILPIYPPLFVLAGAAGLGWGFVPRKIFFVPAALLVAVVADSAATFPNYIAYFNPLVGGSSQGYRHLVDSSADWGMGLPELERWLSRHNPGNHDQVYLAYFGTDSPSARHIVCHQLPSFFNWRLPQPMSALGPGIYAISATLFQSVYSDPSGPWCTLAESRYQTVMGEFAQYEQALRDRERYAAFLQRYPSDIWIRKYDVLEKLRFGRLCAWLRHHSSPIATVGGSILVWRLDEADLRAALSGPPPEVDDTLLQQLLHPQ